MYFLGWFRLSKGLKSPTGFFYLLIVSDHWYNKLSLLALNSIMYIEKLCHFLIVQDV